MTRPSRARRFVALTFLSALTLGVDSSSGVCQAVPRLSLRPADGVAEVQFNRVTGVRELNDGTVLVGDRGETSRLVHIEWHAGGGDQIGGTVPGIGRLVALAGDSTLVVSLTNGRWLLMDGAQAVETAGPPGGLSRRLGFELYGADRRGRVLGMRGSAWSAATRPRVRGTADSVDLLMGDRSSGTVETIGQLRGAGNRGVKEVPASGGRLPHFLVSNPLARQDQALLFLDGWIAIARVDPYRVDWRTPQGREIRGFPLPAEEVVVSAREKCLAMEQSWARFGEPCDPELLPGWPETIPPFIRGLLPTLLAAPDGHLVIERTTSARFFEHRYDFVDREGRLAGVLILDVNQTLIGFGANSVYIVTDGESDLQTLRRHPFAG